MITFIKKLFHTHKYEEIKIINKNSFGKVTLQRCECGKERNVWYEVSEIPYHISYEHVIRNINDLVDFKPQ